MNLKKCVRCGCFFSTSDDVCPNCKTKDEKDKISLKNYIANNEMPDSVERLALNTGVGIKNIARFLKAEEFPEIKKNFKLYSNPSNLSTEL